MSESIGIPLGLWPTIVGMATTIGERIKLAREAKGMKQAELARALKIAAPSLHQLEAGISKEPSAQTLLALEDLGINPRYVMQNKGPMLLSDFERRQELEALVGQISELPDEARAAVVLMVKQLRRTQGGPGADDPFLFDPGQAPPPPKKRPKR
jgi:transcriptional regulator with XRE-family HTH domain